MPPKPRTTLTGKPGAEPDEAELTRRARDLFANWRVAVGKRRVSVVWNWRLRTTAGRARVRGLVIELNPRLLSWQGRAPEILDEVLTHEAAHLAAVALHGRRIAPHGEEWCDLMAQAGYPEASVTHEIDVDDLRRRRSC